MRSCPVHPGTELGRTRRGWYCPACQDIVADLDGELREAALADDGLGSLVEVLPSFLALPLQEYREEGHPVHKLWLACDVIELTLRLLVTLGVAEAAQGGRLPEAAARQFWQRVQKPLLGDWWRMAQALAPGSALLPELVPFVKQDLGPLLDGTTRPASPRSSFVELRNLLAHGGGLSRTAGLGLLEAWRPRFEATIHRAGWLGEIALVARDASGTLGEIRGARHGLAPLPDDARQRLRSVAPAAGSVLALRRSAPDSRVLTLWPLAVYGEPRLPERESAGVGDAPQMFVRREVQLNYTPIGSDWAGQSLGEPAALQAFQRLFRLDQARALSPGFAIRGFEDDLREDAAQVVGRGEEIGHLLGLLRERSEGLIWLSGQAGMGKSFVLARAVVDLLEEGASDTLLLPYRFRAGDLDRCRRDAFLLFAIERLEAAAGPAKAGGRPTPSVKELGSLLEALPGRRRVVFALDGLDELAERDGGFVEDVCLALLRDRVLWLCAGRPERGLPEAFAGAGAIDAFPGGLPPMGAGDVRSMLLERIGPLRRRLLRADRDHGGRVVNAFVEHVTRRSEGLPIYVHYLVADVIAGRLSPEPGVSLPPGVDAYHAELLRRCGVGSLHQVLTPLAATLALAREPLSVEELAALLARRDVLLAGESGPPLVRQGLAAIGSMVRRAPDPDGDEGFTLWHHSLRDHLKSSPTMAEAIATARQAMAKAALRPAGDAAERYLYRQGIGHLLEDGGGPAPALGLLTDFAYLMARLRALQAPGVSGISADWRSVLAKAPPLASEQQLWEAFWHECEHVVRRGDERWPAHRILLQLAHEQAHDSPMTRQAETWLAAGHCDWYWLARIPRSRRVERTSRLRRFEGQDVTFSGALTLDEQRLVSWGLDGLRTWRLEDATTLVRMDAGFPVHGARLMGDGTLLSWGPGPLMVWDPVAGTALRELQGHRARVCGVRQLPDGRLASWSSDGCIRVWNPGLGTCDAVLERYQGPHLGILDVLPLGADRLLARSEDGAVRIWGLPGGTHLLDLHESGASVLGVRVQADGRIVTWGGDFMRGGDNLLRYWSADGHPLGEVRLAGTRATDPHSNVRPNQFTWLSDQVLLGWHGEYTMFGDRALRAWDSASGRLLCTYRGHSNAVLGVEPLADRGLLTWAKDGTVRRWLEDGRPQAVCEGHQGAVNGARAIVIAGTDEIVSWGEDGTVRTWSMATGQLHATLVGHADSVRGVLPIGGRRLASWSNSTLRSWDLSADGAHAAAPPLPARKGLWPLRGGRFVSWHDDDRFRIWQGDAVSPHEVELTLAHADHVQHLSDGRLLAFSRSEPVLLLWDPESGAETRLLGHADDVAGAAEAPSGRVLSWARNGDLRVWDARDGTCLASGGERGGEPRALVLGDGRIVTWPALASSVAGSLHIRDPELRVLGELPAPDGAAIHGARQVAADRLVSWSVRGADLWDLGAYSRVARLEVPASAQAPTEDVPDINLASTLSEQVFATGGKLAVNFWDTRTGRRLFGTSLSGDLLVGIDVLPERCLAALDLRLLDPDDAQVASDLAVGVLPLRLPPVAIWGTRGPIQVLAHPPSGGPEDRLGDWRLFSEFGWHALARVVLEGHTKAVVGVTVLRDGALLSWSADGTIRVWDRRQDRAVVLAANDVPWVAPGLAVAIARAAGREPIGRPSWLSASHPPGLALLEAWRASSLRPLTAHGCLAWSLGRTIALRAPGRERMALWHADSELGLEAVLPDGRVVVSTSDHRIVYLQLRFGGARCALTRRAPRKPESAC
jgi:WD40 repeat protein